MKKKNGKKRSKIAINKRNLVLGVVITAALGALAVMVIFLSNRGPGTQTGVGADGFSVFEIKGADLGITSVVSKQSVVNELGKHAKSVDDVDKSGVVSLNGNKGQTATYNFTTPSGARSSVYVDVLIYQSQSAYDADNVFAGTGSAGKVGDMEVRFLPAVSLGYDREYALLVSKGVKSYKFAMVQPNSKIEINEITAQDILKKLIAIANL